MEKQLLSMFDRINGGYKVFKIVEETELEYVLNNDTKVYKNDMFIDLITHSQLNSAKSRDDIVVMF